MDERETLITRVMDAGGRLKVKSALNPILWLCAIVSVPTIISLNFANEKPVWMVALAVSPVFVAISGFIFLLIWDRDKLQSEDYQIRKRSLELIEQKGDIRAIDAMSAVLIENPEAKRLTGTQEEVNDA